MNNRIMDLIHQPKEKDADRSFQKLLLVAGIALLLCTGICMGFYKLHAQYFYEKNPANLTGNFSDDTDPIEEPPKPLNREKLSEALSEYNAFNSYSKGLIRVSGADMKYGFIGRDGEKVAPCIYSLPLIDESFSEGLLKIITVSEFASAGFIDGRGEVIPCIYEDARPFSEGFAAVKKNGKWGFIDKKGNEAIACIYDDADNFSEGLATVCKKGKWGAIDKNGKKAVPFNYGAYELLSFSDGLARIEKKGKYGFLNKKGKEVIPCVYEDTYDFSEGLARVVKNGKCGFINKAGEVVVPLVYDAYGRVTNGFSGGLAMVGLDGKYGFIDKTGKEIIPCIYGYVGEFSEGLALVAKEYAPKEDGNETKKQCGFVNKNGEVAVSCIYDDAESFSEGLATVCKKGKWGFIDRTGKEVIPCTYEHAGRFSEGLARVKKGGKDGFISRSGKVIIPLQLTVENTGNFKDGLVKAVWNDKEGFVDREGYFIGKGIVKKLQVEEIKKREIAASPPPQNNTDNQDNKWLIGRWGPVTVDGGAFSEMIESVQIEIKILNDHTLVETVRTKLTEAGIKKAMSLGSYKGDVTTNRETRPFSIDNQRNAIVFSKSSKMLFDKKKQLLNYEYGRGKRYSMKKNRS